MADVLKEFETVADRKFGAAKEQYNWHRFLDGQPRMFLRGEDFSESMRCKSFAAAAHLAAKRRGIKCRTSINEQRGQVVLQAILGDDNG